MLSQLCLGFTSFRPETLRAAGEKMRGFEVIAFEEPHTPGFEEMLQEELSVDDYLMLTDFAFAEFARGSCWLMQALHREGKRLLQVDPYMDELVRIHEYFASGGSPDGIAAGTLTREVYSCERIWTGRLIQFYTASRKDDFCGLVNAVKDFARIDAEKGVFRNRLRAEALERLFSEGRSLYVEAGYLHLPLQRELLRRLPSSARFEAFYVQEPVTRRLTGKRLLLNPGDRLTFMYSFQESPDEARADRLAAQSLVYNKIVFKEEHSGSEEEAFPHARDEVRAIELAESLSFAECAELYDEIRALPTEKALAAAQGWLASRGAGSRAPERKA